MKSVLTIACVLALTASLAFAGNPKNYGKTLTLKEVTRVSEILANPEKFNGKRVRVQGAVVDVCSKRGCWIRLASDKEYESIVFKVEDGVIVFPMDAKGKTAVAEGVISAKTYTVEQLIEQGKHQAEETGKPFDPSTVKGPKTVVRIMGEGASIQ
ncbi:MAG: DUF4920 domain-containing protein [Ignavibacteriae bacterium]|nr:DUF4920 domain-containing protein [Ignavibacteriota bacterium]